MNDFIINTATKDSCCPDLSWKTRIIGFLICFFVGLALTFMSIGFIITAVTGNMSFALFWTLGNATCLCSSFFLVGPKKQWANMTKPHRLVCSLVYLASMVLILVNNFIIRWWTLMIIFVTIEICALVWYTLSYIPGGRKCCMNCLKSCWKGENEDEKAASII
jgi:hypothetical protein